MLPQTVEFRSMLTPVAVSVSIAGLLVQSKVNCSCELLSYLSIKGTLKRKISSAVLIALLKYQKKATLAVKGGLLNQKRHEN